MDPMLVNGTGHYLNFDRNLVKEIQKRKLPVTLYANRACQVMCSGLRPELTFARDMFSMAFTDAQTWVIETFFTVNQVFMTDLCGIDPNRFTADDLVFFPNILQNQIYGAMMWLSRLPPERRPTVAMLFRYLDHSIEHQKARCHAELVPLFFAMRRARWQVRIHELFFAPTPMRA